MIVRAPKQWILLGLFLSSAMAALLLLNEGSANKFLGERAFVERTTALLYLLSVGAAVLAVTRTRGLLRLFSSAWLVLSVLCFGEETSWLQHELGFQTPQFMRDRNVQGEFNLHNLEGLHGGKLLEDESSRSALSRLASIQNLFQLGFVAYFACLPAVALFPPVRRRLEWLRLPLPDMRLAAVIWMPIIVVLVFSFTTTGVSKDLAAELREMLYGAAFVQFLVLLATNVAPASPRSKSQT